MRNKTLYILTILFLFGCRSNDTDTVDKTTNNSRDKNRYVTEQAFSENLENQLKMTPKTMSQLKEAGVTTDKELKLEYFFYTNSDIKAKQLADELDRLNYSVDHRLAVDSKTEYVITGWTTKMKMSDDTVIKWTSKMCELGYKYDCDFDGWGTNPDQDIVK